MNTNNLEQNNNSQNFKNKKASSNGTVTFTSNCNMSGESSGGLGFVGGLIIGGLLF